MQSDVAGSTPVSVIIHTLNEEVNLPFALSCVRGWADQIFVVDSGSNDKTAEIARQFGAEMFTRECSRETLVEQRNWALENLPIRNAWVFILDADETMPDALKAEVSTIVASEVQKDGYWCRFRNIFLGRWIKHASMYPTWSLRLFRPEIVRYERRPVNSHPIVAKGREGYLSNDLLHEDRRGFEYFVKRLNEFSTLEARAYASVLSEKAQADLLPGKFFGTRAERRRYLKHTFVRLPMRPIAIFVYLYFVRLGFLDGRAGFDFCIYKAFAEWLVTIKMREAKRLVAA